MCTHASDLSHSQAREKVSLSWLAVSSDTL